MVEWYGLWRQVTLAMHRFPDQIDSSWFVPQFCDWLVKSFIDQLENQMAPFALGLPLAPHHPARFIYLDCAAISGLSAMASTCRAAHRKMEFRELVQALRPLAQCRRRLATEQRLLRELGEVLQ